MIKIVFSGIKRQKNKQLTEKELDKIEGGVAPKGCGCCICSVEVQGGAPTTSTEYARHN